ncbi:MAG: cadherin-like beta sandwich domain-containing protein, partial [Bacilli bacterium]|nr:cadherin-like beta sandwich domain-containing protein [Bacilli bacterium]
MKKSLYVILLLTIFLIGNIEVNASSGQLRKASIKTCNGITYGQHSSDNHWHVAEEKDGKYYATGDPIYSDPCSSNNNSSGNSSSNNNSNDNSSSGGSSNDSSSNNSSSGSSSNNSSSNNSSSGSSSNNNSSNNSSSSSSSNNSSSNNSSNNNQTTTKPEETKSNDNTLKAIIINEENIKIEENMSYSTTDKKLDIKVETNNSKATYEIKNNSNLSVGNNEIVIEVKAEDGSTKNYKINVERKIILSSDTGIKVKIDEEEVVFSNYKATVYVSSSATSISVDYTLSNEKAKVEMDEIDKLKTGDNTLNIKVTAEDGTEQNYEIVIHKYTKAEDTISTILAFAMLGGIGYGIYYLIKKFKNKFKK